MAPRGLITFAMLGSALAVSACSRSAPEPGDAPTVTSVSPSAAPALWEPVDSNFKGCEGG